ncbi:MAG: vWA domain-containing protein [Acidimicrobiales bacterium]
MIGRLFLASAIVASSMGLGATLPQQVAPVPAAISTLQSCLQQGPGDARLLALIVVDGSGSIKSTDPTNQRVAGVRALLSSLAGLSAQAPGGDSVEVFVRISTFATGYAPLVPDPSNGDPQWTRLDETASGKLDSEAGSLGGQDDGAWTNYSQAFTGARRDIAIESSDLTADGSAPPCKLLVFFTDGEISLPGGDAAARAEAAQLCAPGGLPDQLRSDGVITIAIGLASGFANQSSVDFLKRVTEGYSDNQACGSTGTTATGLFIAAANPNDLFFDFGAVDPTVEDEFCPTPALVGCPINVPPGFDGYSLAIQTPVPSAGLDLIAPDGSMIAVPSQQNQQSALAGANVSVRWLGTLDAEVDATQRQGATISGTWNLEFNESGTPQASQSGHVAIRLRTDIIPAIQHLGPLQVGGSTTLNLGFAHPDGTLIVASPILAGSSMTATLRTTTGVDGTVLPVQPVGDGRFVTSVSIPSSFGGSSVQLVLHGVVAPFAGATISLADRVVSLTVNQAVAYPTLSPVPLQLPSVRGHAPSSAILTVTASPNTPGCVWFDPAVVVLPGDERGAGSTAAVQTAPNPHNRESCLFVPARGRRLVRVTVRPDKNDLGVASGHLTVVLEAGRGGALAHISLPISFDMRPPRNVARRWAIFGGLLFLGIVIPAAILIVTARKSTLLGPPQLLRWAAQPITWSRATGLRGDPTGGPVPPSASFVVLASDGAAEGSRSVPIGDLVARRRFGATLWRRLVGLFAGGEAIVASTDRLTVIARSPGLNLAAYPAERAHQVPLSLAATWIFALRSIEEGFGVDDPVVYGTLTYVVPDGHLVDADAERLGQDATDSFPEAVAELRAATSPGIRSQDPGSTGPLWRRGKRPRSGPGRTVDDGSSELPIQ